MPRRPAGIGMKGAQLRGCASRGRIGDRALRVADGSAPGQRRNGQARIRNSKCREHGRQCFQGCNHPRGRGDFWSARVGTSPGPKRGELSDQTVVNNGRDGSNLDSSGHGLDGLIKPIAIDVCRVLISARAVCRT
jgi:hypothetical protein